MVVMMSASKVEDEYGRKSIISYINPHSPTFLVATPERQLPQPLPDTFDDPPNEA